MGLQLKKSVLIDKLKGQLKAIEADKAKAKAKYYAEVRKYFAELAKDAAMVAAAKTDEQLKKVLDNKGLQGRLGSSPALHTSNFNYRKEAVEQALAELELVDGDTVSTHSNKNLLALATGSKNYYY